MKAISDTISGITIGTPTTFRNLTLFPLAGGDENKADYITLDEALGTKSARITEVSEGGSVPELKFINESKMPVFLLDGEELIGAKQNRVLNLSIMVPAGKTLIIPVSCVERGRWHHRSREFSSSPRAHYSEGRAKRMSQVTASLKSMGARHSDQGQIWHDIDLKFQKFAGSSPTSAMSDIYEQQTSLLEDYVRSFVPADGQKGVMFAINGRVAGFELFDCAETLRKLFPKLLRSYALDALDSSRDQESGSKIPSPADAAKFLQRVRRAELKSFPAIGEGEDVRISAPNLTGAVLAKEERAVHLSAFRLGGSSSPKSRVPRESQLPPA